MAKIKIDDLTLADFELTKNSQSFMKDLVNNEIDVIGGWSFGSSFGFGLGTIFEHWYSTDDGPNILRRIYPS